MNGIVPTLRAIAEANTILQWFAFLLFTALIPLFSAISVFGIAKTARARREGLDRCFPALTRTAHRLLYENSETQAIGRIALSRYVLPILFLFLLNVLMSMVLLDFMRLTDQPIEHGAKVYILCGGHCSDPDPLRLTEYQTQTFVAAAYAFLGWMVWTFGTIFDRVSALQLFPSTFNRLLIRLVISVLVAIVVRHVIPDAGDWAKTSGPGLSFAIGMFPEAGLSMIMNKFHGWLRADTHSEDFHLELLEGISPSLTYRLVELGIDDGVAMASANPFSIFDASTTQMTEIVDWIAQAQLLVLLKADRFHTLQKAGYRTIFDFVRLMNSPNGPDALRALCNWNIPAGYDPVGSIGANADYKRLAEIYAAIGSDAP